MVPPLPEEILALILEEFALPKYDMFCTGRMGKWRGGPRPCMTTLSNACLASKMMYRLAWPILYRYFNNGWWMDLAQKLDTARFLQTICTKPGHGLALRSLSIAKWEPLDAMDPTELFERLHGDATLVDFFQRRAKFFWLGEDQMSSLPPAEMHHDGSLSSEILRSLGLGLPEAHMAMLLLLSPKLKTLYISSPSQFESSIIARLMDLAVSEDYRMMQIPERPYEPEQEESDYAIAQMFGASWPGPTMQKASTFQDLVKCAILGSGRCPSGLRFFKNLISLPAILDVSLSGLQGGYDIAMSDLEIGVPRSRLRKLSLPVCDLLTSEAAKIIQCCPELSTLEMTWRVGLDRSSQSSERDQRLQFGIIADAIAAHMPKLTFLRLSADEWPHRHFSSKYPYTIGTSLQRLKHLENLDLDHYMIYGMQHLEELSLDTYVDQSNTAPFFLGRVVPKSIEFLTIGASEFVLRLDGESEPADEWQDWQLEDLQRFLLDRSFERMYVVMFAHGSDMNREHVNAEVLAKHGWEVILGHEDEWYYKLENRGRERTNST